MDLFTPTVSPERFNPNFAAAIDETSAGERAVINGWAEGFVDRDGGKFIQQFQTTFNSAFWELYLHAVLRRFGFMVDWSHESPDFCLSKGAANLVVEATTANAAQDKPKEWERELTPAALVQYPIPRVNHEAMIRLANALVAKHRKYLENYRKLNHVGGRPFVIAVAPFDQPFFHLQMDRPVRAVLYDDYVDEEAYKKNPAKYPNGPPSVRLGTITKDSGAEIELGFFESPVMEEVSAVIYSCVATWGKTNALAAGGPKRSYFSAIRTDEVGRPQQTVDVPKSSYRENLEDGLQVYHNAFARYPLDPALLRADGVVQHFFDEKTKHWVREGLGGALLWRTVRSVVPRGSDGAIVPPGSA